MKNPKFLPGDLVKFNCYEKIVMISKVTNCVWSEGLEWEYNIDGWENGLVEENKLEYFNPSSQ